MNTFDVNIEVLKKIGVNTEGLTCDIDTEVVNIAAFFVSIINICCKDRIIESKRRNLDQVIGLFVDRLGFKGHIIKIEQQFYRKSQFNVYDVVRCCDMTSLNDTSLSHLSTLQPTDTKQYGIYHSAIIPSKNKRMLCRRVIKDFANRIVKSDINYDNNTFTFDPISVITLLVNR